MATARWLREGGLGGGVLAGGSWADFWGLCGGVRGIGRGMLVSRRAVRVVGSNIDAYVVR